MKRALFLIFCTVAVALPQVGAAALIYKPKRLDRAKASLVVVVHGCLQSPESMALGTGWNEIADANNLVVLYPQVPAGSNPLGCWSWYLPEHQRADSGQLKTLRDEIAAVKREQQILRAPVFLAGMSSGGATVAGLIACFPKEFAGGAIHSAPSYALAATLPEAEKILKEGPPTARPEAPCKPRDFRGSLIVLHGAGDVGVHPLHAQQVVSDFIGLTKAGEEKQLVAGELRYALTDFTAEHGGKGRLVMIEGLPHAWSGYGTNLRYSAFVGPTGKFPTQLPFFSATGPSATNLIWEFFQEIPRPAKSAKAKRKP